MDPATALTIAAVSSAAGAGVAAIGAISSAQAQSAASRYNAALAEDAARQAREAAAFEEQRARDRARRVASAQRAGFAASGVMLEGSPLELLAETAQEAELDALAIRRAGSAEAARYRGQAALDRLQASVARTRGYFEAGASLLGGASSFGRIYGRGEGLL